MIKKVFLWVLIGVLVYSGIAVGMPWFRNYLFQSALDEAIKEVGYQSLQHVRADLLLNARQNGIPIDDSNLVTTRDEESGLVTIEARYTVTVNLGGETYSKVWNFHPWAQRVVKAAPGGLF